MEAKETKGEKAKNISLDAYWKSIADLRDSGSLRFLWTLTV